MSIILRGSVIEKEKHFSLSLRPILSQESTLCPKTFFAEFSGNNLMVPLVKLNSTSVCSSSSEDCFSAMRWVDGSSVDKSWFDSFDIAMTGYQYCLAYSGTTSKIGVHGCEANAFTICEFDCDNGKHRTQAKTCLAEEPQPDRPSDVKMELPCYGNVDMSLKRVCFQR